MDEFSYPSGEGDGSVIDERLQTLLLRMQDLEQGKALPIEAESIKEELDQIVHNLEDVKEQMKGMGNLPPKTQQLLSQIRSLVQHYNIRIVQHSYQSLISATNSLQILTL